MKKVLFIAYYFPPVGGGGVQRSSKFVKYLPEFGWRPLVLTVREPYDFHSDGGLLKDIPPDTAIYRSFSIEPMKWVRKLIYLFWSKKVSEGGGKAKGSAKPNLKRKFLVNLKNTLLFPDNEILWLPFAVWKGWQIIRQEKPEAIYSTASPFTDHLIAMILSRFTGLPWVADFRDFWVDRPNFPDLRWRRFIDRVLEGIAVRRVSHLVTVSHYIGQRYAELYPGTKYTIIPNGYDEADFIAIDEEESQDSKKFLILYSGIMNKERNPRLFFQALRELIDEDPEFADAVWFRFIGAMDEPGEFDNIRLFESLGLDRYGEVWPYRPHEEVLRQMRRATVLFLLIGHYPHCEAVLTGKIFEYLRSRRPILAVVPPTGAAAQVIRETGSGVVADHQNKNSIKAALKQLFAEFRQNQLEKKYLSQNIDRFERRNLSAQLAKVLSEISGDAV
ncbi:MAG: glycosyltransferase [Calditrichia bacterium]